MLAAATLHADPDAGSVFQKRTDDASLVGPVRVGHEYESKWSDASVGVTLHVDGLLSCVSGLSRVFKITHLFRGS